MLRHNSFTNLSKKELNNEEEEGELCEGEREEEETDSEDGEEKHSETSSEEEEESDCDEEEKERGSNGDEKEKSNCEDEEEGGEQNLQVSSRKEMNASNLNVEEKDRSPSVNSEISVIEDSNANESQSFKQVNCVHLRVRKHNDNVATIINGVDPQFSCWKILKGFQRKVKFHRRSCSRSGFGSYNSIRGRP
ncbi:hypothetical protein FRX31_025925 [Thalictrum thalictroides]|uniref:Uncharacterized protein n=1 Tax=Thalictrum thalictroides TaxID=46969 RepID=A0A7J6VHC0_THATH|nr:hypothetical protein FRX31_025925 [Thalictrum thalictroides]